MKSKKISLIIRTLITIIICYIILARTDLRSLLSTVKGIKPNAILGVSILFFLSITISSWKWKVILSIHNIHINFTQLLKYYLSASFFNNFLPTSIGGDGYRIYKTAQYAHSKTKAVLAVVSERVTGLIALLLLGLLGYLWSSSRYPEISNELEKVSIILGLLLSGLIIIILVAFFLNSQ